MFDVVRYDIQYVIVHTNILIKQTLNINNYFIIKYWILLNFCNSLQV